jgi:hypothetical protein
VTAEFSFEGGPDEVYDRLVALSDPGLHHEADFGRFYERLAGVLPTGEQPRGDQQ